MQIKIFIFPCLTLLFISLVQATRVLDTNENFNLDYSELNPQNNFISESNLTTSDDIATQSDLDLPVNALWVWSDDFSHFFINKKNSDEWVEITGQDRNIVARFKLFKFDQSDPIIYDKGRDMYIKIRDNSWIWTEKSVGNFDNSASGIAGGWIIKPPKPKPKPTPKPTPPTPPQTNCGLPIHKPNSNLRRVIGGQKAIPYSWPWMVAVRIKTSNGGQISCGGSIINNNWIATAAHCIASESIFINAGINNINEQINKYQASKVIKHPNYNPSALKNDIALLKLSRPLKYNDKIQPVCLPKANSNLARTGKISILTGWGVKVQKGGGSDILLEVAIPIRELDYCKANLDKKTQLCAGDYSEDPALIKSSCFGDSGGPLVIMNEQKRYSLVGIVSGGPDPCNGQGYYTKVDAFIDWISKTIKNN